MFGFDTVGVNKMPTYLMVNVIILVKNTDETDQQNSRINIQEPWAEYYFKSLNNPYLNPSPPSIKQIEQSELNQNQK